MCIDLLLFYSILIIDAYGVSFCDGMWWLAGDVFQWLAGNSSKRLDIIAQYWELLAAPDDPRSRDYGYSKANMQEFGAKEGYDVYKAIENAADRNVNVRYGFFFFFF